MGCFEDAPSAADETEQIRERGLYQKRIYMPFESVIRIEFLKGVRMGYAEKPGHLSKRIWIW